MPQNYTSAAPVRCYDHTKFDAIPLEGCGVIELKRLCTQEHMCMCV